MTYSRTAVDFDLLLFFYDKNGSQSRKALQILQRCQLRYSNGSRTVGVQPIMQHKYTQKKQVTLNWLPASRPTKN